MVWVAWDHRTILLMLVAKLNHRTVPSPRRIIKSNLHNKTPLVESNHHLEHLQVVEVLVKEEDRQEVEEEVVVVECNKDSCLSAAIIQFLPVLAAKCQMLLQSRKMRKTKMSSRRLISRAFNWIEIPQIMMR